MAKHEISLEYASLVQQGHCPTGFYLMPSPSDVHLWHGVLFIHKGPYAGSILRFLLSFPPAFPSSSPPSIHFLPTPIWHPLVDPATGRLDTRGGRWARWKPRESHISTYLHWAKGVFKTEGLKAITESQAANKEAWRLFRDNPALFATLAHQSASLSSSPSTLYASSSSRRAPHHSPSLGQGLRAEEENEGQEVVRFDRLEEAEVHEIKQKMQASLGISASA